MRFDLWQMMKMQERRKGLVSPILKLLIEYRSILRLLYDFIPGRDGQDFHSVLRAGAG